MRQLLTSLAAAAAGAAAMYYLDPDSGRRRRALVRDKAVSVTNDANEFARAKGRYASDRVKGIAAEARSKLHFGKSNDTDLTSSLSRSEDGSDGSGASRRRLRRLLPLAAVAAPIAIMVAASARPESRSPWKTWHRTNPLTRMVPTLHHRGPVTRARHYVKELWPS